MEIARAPRQQWHTDQRLSDGAAAAAA